jgi:hypothetical protein
MIPKIVSITQQNELLLDNLKAFAWGYFCVEVLNLRSDKPDLGRTFIPLFMTKVVFLGS